MSEPIEPTPEAAELAILKKAHSEVLTKRQKDKSRIAELESTVAGLQGKLTESDEIIRQVTIGVPLRAMAESMSPVPELFIEQFSKHYTVEMVKDRLALLNADGTPVLDKEQKPVPFERGALTTLLTSDDNASAKTFKAITISNRASGAANSNDTQQGKRASSATKPTFQFGLR